MHSIDFEPFAFLPFRDAHTEGVIDLLRRCYGEYGQVLELDTLDDDLPCIPERYPDPHVFRVLLEGKRVVGTVAVKLGSPGEAELKRVFLDAELRGQGLGKRLSLWAIQWARDQGCSLLHVWSDVLFETAHGLYRKLGGEDTGQRRALGGANDVEEFYFPIRL